MASAKYMLCRTFGAILYSAVEQNDNKSFSNREKRGFGQKQGLFLLLYTLKSFAFSARMLYNTVKLD